MISIAELYDLFIDTIQRCSTKTLNQSDEMIEYDLFEEFDIGAISFLHKNALDRLLENKYIDEHIYILCVELRKKGLNLLENKRTIEQVKTDPDWQDLFRLSDQISDLLKKRIAF